MQNRVQSPIHSPMTEERDIEESEDFAEEIVRSVTASMEIENLKVDRDCAGEVISEIRSFSAKRPEVSDL